MADDKSIDPSSSSEEEFEDDDQMEEEEESESNDEDDNEPTYLLDTIREIENRAPIHQLLLSQLPLLDSSPNKNLDAERISPLQVHSLASIINADLLDNPTEREPESVLLETCSRLIQILQNIYQRQQQQQQGTLLVADPMGMDALQRAISTRLKALPDNRRHDIDGCPNIIIPPDTTGQILPSTLTKKVEEFLTNLKKIGNFLQSRWENDDKSLKSVDQVREMENGPTILDFALMNMFQGYPFEDCLAAFSNPHDENYSDDEWIHDFSIGADEDNVNVKMRGTTQVCAFAGVLRALKDKKSGGGKRGETSEIEYEEEEPEMYHGWSGSWQVDEDEVQKNDLFYGVKLGAILHHAEEQAKKMVKGSSSSGSVYSSPWARFHEDMSDEKVLPKASDEPATAHDIRMCRLRHRDLEDDAFYGDNGVYSSKQWAHDGTIGFAHQGGGWKNREFLGHLYSFDNPSVSDYSIRGYDTRRLANEFWCTPTSILADSTNSTVWVHADDRIKGFSADQRNGHSLTSYIFNVERNAKPSQTAGKAKRQKLTEKDEERQHGDAHLMVLGGSDRLAYLDSYVLQEWKLNEANRHDGTHRMIYMESLDEDLAQWRKEDILNLSENTWMDDTGKAEATRGLKPDAIRTVDIATPSSIGYLPDDRLAFAHEGSSLISIYNHELREVSRLAGFGSDGIDIVQRPTFARIGDETAFVASDSSCVKVFDLRSGKAEMTIRQRVVNSTPVYMKDAKFVCNKLMGGQGAMMWDLRSQKPLYSLPISGNTDIAWVPALDDGPSSPPILLTSNGQCYNYGQDFPQGNEWEKEAALSAWSTLEKKGSSDNGDCCIM